MAICSLSKSLLRSNVCSYQLNEITQIFLANFSDISATSIADCDGTGGTTNGVIVTAITLASGAKWSKVEPARNSAAYSDVLNVTDSGAKYRTHQLQFNFNAPVDCNTPDIVDSLSLGKYVAVVTLADGSNVMLGRLAGIEAETVTLGGEAGAEAANGLQVVLNGNQAESVLPVSEDVMTTIKANLND